MEKVHTIVAPTVQLVDKERNIYTDKSIAEFIIPELVCFQDSSYHVVEELCVDDGQMPFSDKVLANDDSKTFLKSDDKADLRSLSRSADSLDDNHDQVANEDKPASTECFVSEVKDCDVKFEQEGCLDGFEVQILPKETSMLCESSLKDCVIGFEQKNGTKGVAAEVMAPQILSTRLESEPQNVHTTDSVSSGANNEPHLKQDECLDGFEAQILSEDTPTHSESSLKGLESDLELKNGIDYVPTEETAPNIIPSKLEESEKVPPTDSVTSGAKNEPQLATEKIFQAQKIAENGTDSSEMAKESSLKIDNSNENPTEHKDSYATATSGLFSPSETSDVGNDTESQDTLQQPRPSFSMFSAEDDDFFDGLYGSKRSLFIQNGLAELNTSRNSVSGSIAFSGQLTSAGNVSFRSESSTGSTRSFAFPVLASEWNSSPIKMAKGDRRLLKRHWGWKQKVLCCKF